MAASEVPQMLTQAGLSVVGGRLGTALSGAVLAHHRARPALRDPEPLLDALHRDPPAVRGHHFPSASSLSIALSSSASANSFLSLLGCEAPRRRIEAVAFSSWRAVPCWAGFGIDSRISPLAALTHARVERRREQTQDRPAPHRDRSQPRGRAHLTLSTACASSVRRMHAASPCHQGRPSPSPSGIGSRKRQACLTTPFIPAREASRHGTMGTIHACEARAPARPERDHVRNGHTRCPDLGRPR